MKTTFINNITNARYDCIARIAILFIIARLRSIIQLVYLNTTRIALVIVWSCQCTIRSLDGVVHTTTLFAYSVMLVIIMVVVYVEKLVMTQAGMVGWRAVLLLVCEFMWQ